MQEISHNSIQRPFFGTQKVLSETISTLDNKWVVEFWEIHYYAFGIEIFRFKREVVHQKRSLKKQA